MLSILLFLLCFRSFVGENTTRGKYCWGPCGEGGKTPLRMSVSKPSSRSRREENVSILALFSINIPTTHSLELLISLSTMYEEVKS